VDQDWPFDTEKRDGPSLLSRTRHPSKSSALAILYLLALYFAGVHGEIVLYGYGREALQ